MRKATKKKETFKGYYYCYIYGNGAPTVTHQTYAAAEKEAKRLMGQTHRSVEILRCVAKCEVAPKIIKAEEIK